MPSNINLNRKGRTRDAIFAVLASNPGQTAEELAAAIDGSLASTRTTLARLTQHGGVLARYRRGRDFVYTLAQQVAGPTKEPEAVNADISALQAKLAELEAFKAKALADHPELAIDNLEQYREVLAQHYDFARLDIYADAIRSGEELDEDDIATVQHLIDIADQINAVRNA